ncbi:MAG: RNA-binding transcriptional accessory protein [Anaerolineales bacterium]|nr:RNA-binding transcriptional accessory protein [Anaerolineales bacterium]
MQMIEKIAKALNVKPGQVAATVELLDAGNTIPFIARYRKEATHQLDEEQIRGVNEWVEKLRALDERRATVLKTIEEQGQLSDELRKQIMAVESLTELEDLYRPYRPKRKTRASMAKEKGLAGLADLVVKQERSGKSLAALVEPYLNAEVPTQEEALSGAMDIVAEMLSDHPDIRKRLREKALEWARIQVEKLPKAEDEKRVFESYYDFEIGVNRLRPHQALAINRGEQQKVLRVKVDVPERDWRGVIEYYFRAHPGSPLADAMRQAVEDGANRLLLPAIERDVRRTLTEMAESHAIEVFARNLRALLTQPPLANRTVLGLDPGFRTGSKLAVVDATGKVLAAGTIYPHAPQKKWAEAKQTLTGLIEKYDVALIAIGNGTASRETELLTAELIKELATEKDENAPQYLIVNEAGASVYSASPLARAELPDYDVSIRGAVSIARRVQDPLAELVKIDPKSIGVGLYQHDVDQGALAHSLNAVVESVVNRVGVDVNTASPALLQHVAGIGPKLAENMVAYRDEHGSFQARRELTDVSGLGPKAFEQAAGFLRIRAGKNPLDASAIHPESYKVADKVMSQAGITMEQSVEERQAGLDALLQAQKLEVLAEALGVGVPTLEDIFDQLLRPGRDPRDEVEPPILRSDVLSMDDLKTGMRLKGTVRNVVDFGAFVDIGVKQDGLLHRSKIPQGERLKVGDIIDVSILGVESERGRISLGWVNGGG